MTSLLREREGKLQTGSRAKSLSTQLWSIPWEEVLPYQFQGTDFYLDISSYDEMMEFLSKNASQVFTQNEFDNRFLNKENSVAKTRFYREIADVFAYKLNEKIVGFFAMNAVDWSTCYFRYTNILPEYRGQNLTEKN